MKKRFVAGLLAVMLSFSMTVTSFAAEIPQGETGEQSVETEEDQTNTEEESKEDDSVIESSENQAGESNLDFAEKEVTAKADTGEETVSAYKVEAKAAVEDTSKWNAEDFTYEEMSKNCMAVIIPENLQFLESLYPAFRSQDLRNWRQIRNL